MRLFGISFLGVAFFLTVLYGQDPQGSGKVPPAMRGAISRIVAGNVTPPVGPTFGRPSPVERRQMEAACSVPLEEMQVTHPEQFAMRKARARNTNDAMPIAKGLPPCQPRR